MSQSNELAVNFSGSLAPTVSDGALDLSAAHCFRFVRQRWFAGAGAGVKGGLMILTGGFLLSQIPFTPKLVVQMAFLGVLLILGGIAFVATSLRDFFGSLAIDKNGYRGNLGLTGFSGKWGNVTNWRVNASTHSPDAKAVEIWNRDRPGSFTIPAGFLSEPQCHRVRQLLRAFAPYDEGDSHDCSAYASRA